MMDWNTLLNKDRRRRSTSPGDHRTEFERDWDRAIFSTPVKRLQDKTQVFPLEPIDAVRTRLTHSLEVSSVARGLGMAVGQWLLDKKYIDAGMERCIEAITATCGLVHDLGNPPFGHSGEDAIRHWFDSRFAITKDNTGKKVDPLLRLLDDRRQLVADFRSFEGNAQTLRLLTKLQILADFYGLNLTYGTLSAACKYVVPSHEVDKSNQAHKKPGYFASENEVVADIQAQTGTGKARHPLTSLVEAADDIVFSVADVEDAVKKGVVAWSDVHSLLKSKGDQGIDKALENGETILKAGRANCPKELPGDVYASAFRTGAIAIAVPAVVEAFKRNHDAIMAGTYIKELIADCTAAPLISELKDLGARRVYNTPPNLKLELMGRRIILDLMDVFWEGAKELPIDKPVTAGKFAGKAGALLSENYRRVFQYWVKEQKDLPEIYHRLLLVTDYVSGMTDTFAKKLHCELMNG